MDRRKTAVMVFLFAAAGGLFHLLADWLNRRAVTFVLGTVN